MAPKIKWETDYYDLLFEFIQFRSEHLNGNLLDSIKDFKNYMTKEEQPFKWSDELVKEYGEWYKITQGNLNTYSDLWGKDLFKFFKDMHLIKQQTNTIPSGEERSFIGKRIISDEAPDPLTHKVAFEEFLNQKSQPKTERIEKQPFQWSDELIKEMIYQKLPLPNHYAGNVQKCLNEFKKSKQQTSDE